VEVRFRKNLCTNQPATKQFNPAKCPNAELIAPNIMGLPIHPLLKDYELHYVVEVIKEIE